MDKDEQKQHHQDLFENWLKDYYNFTDKENQSNNKKTTSKIIDSERRKKIISILKNEIVDHNLKHYVKSQKFNIMKTDVDEFLYKEVSKKNGKQNLPVAIKENFFEILYEIHSIQRGHIGVMKTENLVQSRYYGFSRMVVQKFISMCSICNMKTVQQSQPRIKPIRSDDFWSRMQIDLIDMRHKPCIKKGKTYNWIAHVEDHFSKFHIVWAMEHKSSDEVTEGLRRFVFPYFGLPLIFQCDNGREFKNQQVRELINDWEGDCKIIHGRPRHPQSQGLVEQANGTLERMLASFMVQFNDNDWEGFLPKIMYNLNTQQSSCEYFFYFFHY